MQAITGPDSGFLFTEVQPVASHMVMPHGFLMSECEDVGDEGLFMGRGQI